eukprot:TRINITY_DN84118_c0_g1_i1.p1 TRINITY_DN84118_c0_g1~~TRINITY_DN84118_c0_g1_i1.p1  ORF type:complete len:459 (-),score=90.91 TRINITY_DN84118_c0_g1_i1:121-1329(-)
MKEIISNLTGNTTAFALTAFASSRSNFEKFIHDVKFYYADIYQDEVLLVEFKQFVNLWLKVYSQSLLEPCVLVQGLDEELDACLSVQEVCDSVADRVRKTQEVSLTYCNEELQSNLDEGQRTLQDARGALPSTPVSPVAEGSIASSDVSSFREGQKCGFSWIRFKCAGCGLQVERTRDRNFVWDWPLTIGLCIISVTVLSSRHAQHLSLLLLDIPFMVLSVSASKPFLTALFGVNLLCLLSILLCFEQIDEIAKLQRMQAVYKVKRKKLEAKAQRARDRWVKVQQLFDLWNYRTQPFLSIMGKLQRCLDSNDRYHSHRPPQERTKEAELQRVRWLQCINQQLTALDQHLEAVPWTTEEAQDSVKRQMLGRQLREAEFEENIELWLSQQAPGHHHTSKRRYTT